jgi:beta-galactosidase
MRNRCGLVALLSLAMGASGIAAQEKPAPVPRAAPESVEEHVPKVRLSPPPVWVAGVQQCEIPLKRNDFDWKTGPVIPADWSGKRVKLFYNVSPCGSGKGGLAARATVNGRQFEVPGNSTFCSVEFDITEAVKFGEKNTFPPTGRSSSPVWLRVLPPANVSCLEVETAFDAEYRDATMEVSLAVNNEGTSDAHRLRAVYELIGPDGKGWETEPAETEIGALKAGENRKLAPKLKVKSPLKWDAEHPNLYHLQCSLFEAGKKLETARRRFGFRQVDLRGNQLYINNRPAKVRGAVLFWVQPGLQHNHHPLDLETGRQSLLLTRDANVNHLRPAWYAPVMIDMCDEIGLTCVPGGNWGLGGASWPRRELIELAAFMIATHKSNPSAIMWSVVNEAWGPQYEAMARYIKTIDRRPVCASTVHTGKGGLPGLDIDNDHYPSNRGMTEQVKNGRGWYYDEFCHTSAYEMKMDSYDYGVIDQWGDMFEENWEGAYNTRGVIGATVFAFYGFCSFPAANNPLDAWMRPTASYWHVKKIYCPVRVKEAPLPVPEAGKPPRIEVENRGEFNLNIYRFDWNVGEQKGTLRPDVPPYSKGVIEIPAKAAIGQQVALTVTSPRGFVMNTYLLPIGPVSPPAAPKPSFTGALAIRQDAAEITLEGQGFSWRLDRKTGLIKSGRIGERPVVAGGPSLYLGGPVPRDVKDMASLGTYTDWTPSEVKVNEGADGVTVTVEGAYKAAKGRYTLAFDGAGRLEVRYDFVNTAPNPTGHRASGYREVGVLLEVSGKCDTLRWQRRAKWTTSPDDHIGRPEGTARLSRAGGWPLTPERFEEARKAERDRIIQLYRTGADIPVPDWPWALEEGPNGTHDFGSTKYNIYQASLAGADGMGLRVESDGSQHARCKIRGDHVDFVVNDFSGSSYQSHLAWFKSIKKVLKEGDKIQGAARFRLIQAVKLLESLK